MIAELGQIALLSALMVSLLLGILPMIGTRTQNAGLMAVAPVGAVVQAALVGVAFLLLVMAVVIFLVAALTDAPKLFQIYVHKDPALTTDLIGRCKEARFDALALTVDAIVAGNRERDYHTGMTTPPKLTLRSLLSFAAHPHWSLNYLLRERFDLPNISGFTSAGSSAEMSVVDYLDTQLQRSIDWDDAAAMVEEWGGPFAVKGVMSAADARRCVDIGASAVMISNHGGRQLDGSRTPFDQLASILDEVGGEIEVIVDGGIRRGTHVLKAMAMGATAVTPRRSSRALTRLASVKRAGGWVWCPRASSLRAPSAIHVESRSAKGTTQMLSGSLKACWPG